MIVHIPPSVHARSRLIRPRVEHLGHGRGNGQDVLGPDPAESWACPLLGIVAIVPFVELLFPDGRVFPETIYSDYQSFQLPIREFARSEWLAGRFPHWNPHVLAGWSQHAGQQSASCHPVLAPSIILLGANLGTKLTVFLHLVWAFLGQFLLARHWNISRWASGYAALVFVQSAYLIDHLMAGHINLVLGYAVLPWFLLCSLKLLRDPRPAICGQLAFVTALLVLVGHPQTLVYALILGLAWCGLMRWCDGSPVSVYRCLRFFVTSMITAALLSGAQLFPALELVWDGWSVSPRSHASFANQMSLDGMDLMRLWMPSVRGAILRGLPEWNPLDYAHERSGYLGQTAFWLAVAVCMSRDTRRWQRCTCGMALVCVLFGLGSNSLVFRILTMLMPVLHWFRCPGRALSLYCCVLPLVAASGLDMFTRPSARGGFGSKWWVVCILGFAGQGILPPIWESIWQMSSEHYAVFSGWYLFWEWIRTLLLTAVCWALLVPRLVGRQARRSVWVFAVLLLTICDLGWANTRSFRLERPLTDQTSSGKAGSLAHRFLPSGRFPHVTSDELRYAKSTRLAHRNNWSTVATNEGGILPRNCVSLHRALLFNAKVASCLAACDLMLDIKSGRFERLQCVLPRLRFLDYSSQDLWNVPLQNVSSNQLTRLAQSDPATVVRLLETNPQSTKLRIWSPRGGMLVLAECGDRNWQVIVDGQPVERFDVHGVFLGVVVGPGEHAVLFHYVPRWFRIGLHATAVGALLVCLFCFVCR